MKIVNPYENLKGQWIKGALHVHTTNSDGADPTAKVLADYAGRGYGVVALTDHNYIPTPEEMTLGKGIVVLRGCEYRARKAYPEVGVVGLAGDLPYEIELKDSMEVVKKTGAFVIYNHPNWHFDHWPAKPMLTYRGAQAVEIYNGVVEELQGPAEATDKWDRMLTSGYRIWGVAADDAHTIVHRDKGWVMVDSPADPAAVVAALKAGRFYASTGVKVEEIRLDGKTLHVRAPGASVIRFIVERGTVRKSVSGDTASYDIREDDVYVRAECWGTGMARAWLNPVFVESERSKELSDRFASWYMQGAMT